MDKWKTEVVRVTEEKRREEKRREEKRREEKRREEKRREEKRRRKKIKKRKSQKKEDQKEKVSEERRSSLKRRVRSQLVRWEMKNCTRLWREAHFQVKMYKAHHARSTFGSCDVEKVHAVVARSTFPSPTCKKTDGYGALLDVQMCFRVAGARDCAPCQKWAKRGVL